MSGKNAEAPNPGVAQRRCDEECWGSFQPHNHLSVKNFTNFCLCVVVLLPSIQFVQQVIVSTAFISTGVTNHFCHCLLTFMVFWQQHTECKANEVCSETYPDLESFVLRPASWVSSLDGFEPTCPALSAAKNYDINGNCASQCKLFLTCACWFKNDFAADVLGFGNDDHRPNKDGIDSLRSPGCYMWVRQPFLTTCEAGIFMTARSNT